MAQPEIYCRVEKRSGDLIVEYQRDDSGEYLECNERAYGSNDEQRALRIAAVWRTPDGKLVKDPDLLKELEEHWATDALEN